ncbi:MAG TPA: hypothetical protein VJJ52_03040 [Candidatus Nanoarchaeia archaeon]|nr:hypothetical protein [Candidatus Nanoarchaeia archaeon]
MKNKEEFIKICPKCGSIDLPIKSNFIDMLMPVAEKCEKCGYSGLFPEINIKEIEDFRKNFNKNSG